MTQLLYYCAQTLIKLSLLLLYNRVFGVGRPFRIALYVAGALTISWWLAAFIDTIFQCIPVQYSWNMDMKNGRCQDIRAAALGTGISNLILDVLLLALPLPMIWQIKIDRKIRVSLTGIFLLGALYVFMLTMIWPLLTITYPVCAQPQV